MDTLKRYPRSMPQITCLKNVGLHYILDIINKRIAGSGPIGYCYCTKQNSKQGTTTCHGKDNTNDEI